MPALRTLMLMRWAAEEERRILEIHLTTSRLLRDKTNPFTMDEEKFRSFYRVSRELARYLCEKMHDVLTAGRKDAVPPYQQILASLRFFAHGDSKLAMKQEGILELSQPALSKYIRKFTTAICCLFGTHIKFPATAAERDATQRRFSAWPGILGLVDCTYVTLYTPYHHNDAYRNCHGYHSLNVQMICDADLRIQHVVAGYPGSVHDQFIWDYCGAKAELQRLHQEKLGNFMVLGGTSYTNDVTMMTPLEGAAVGTPEFLYTQAHKEMHGDAKRLFGVLRARWNCLKRDKPLHYQPKQAGEFVNACAILHNLMIHYRLPLPDDVEEGDIEDEPKLPPVTTDIDEDDPCPDDLLCAEIAAEGLRARRNLIDTYFTNR